MAYCTQADLLMQISENDLIQLTDDAGAGAVDTDVVDRAIADADAEIDAYCGGRYEVPFATVPAVVRKTAVDIVLYNLCGRQPLGDMDERTRRYEAALRLLREVARGTASLGAGAPSTDDDTGPEATTARGDRVFRAGRSSDSATTTLDNY